VYPECDVPEETKFPPFNTRYGSGGGSNIQSAQLPGKHEIRGCEGSIGKNEAQEEDMWAKNKEGIEDNFKKEEFVPSVRVSSASNQRRTKRARREEQEQNLRIFYAEKLLRELAYKFY